MKVRYRNGVIELRDGIEGLVDLAMNGVQVSAPMVDQALEGAQEELQKRCGCYAWTTAGYTGQYSIVAWVPGDVVSSWVEARGKSPRDVLVAFLRIKGVEVRV